MSLLSPWVLWALPALLIPVAIHLIHRRRHRTVEWGAMLFLLEGMRMSRGRQRLREILLLTMRTLAVLGLILAMGRPLAGGWIGRAGASGIDTVILLVDRSASMGERLPGRPISKLKHGLGAVAAALEATAPEDLVVIDAVDPGRVVRVGGAGGLGALELGVTTDAASDFPMAFESALAYLEASGTGTTEIWAVTDGQAGDWAQDDGRWAAVAEGLAAHTAGVRIRLLTFPGRDPRNLAVRVERARVQGSDTGADLVLDLVVEEPSSAVDVEVGAQETRSVKVAVDVGGARSTVEVELIGREGRLQGYRLPLDAGTESGFGEVTLAPDVHPADDRYWFAFGDTAPLETLVVSGRQDVRRVLRVAAEVPPEDGTPVTVRAVDAPLSSPPGPDGPELDLRGVSLVLWQAPLPAESSEGAEVAARLRAFVDSGGVILFLPPDVPGDGSFHGLGWNTWRRGASLPGPDAWRSDDDLLRRGSDGIPLPLGDLELRAHCGILDVGESSSHPRWTLASLAGGERLLVRAQTESGGVYFFGALPTQDSTNLATDGLVLMAMVQRGLGLAQGERGSLLQREAGAAAGFPADLTASRWRPVAGDALEAGPHRGRHMAGVLSDGERFVGLNRSPEEDSGSPLGLDALGDLFGELDVVGVETRDGRGEGGLMEEIWRVFMALAVFALITEALLSYPVRLFSRSMALLELLRWTLIAGMIFLLTGPEWVRTVTPELSPEVVLLVDGSGSMGTRDVSQREGPVSRQRAVAERMEEDFPGGTVELDGGRFQLRVQPLENEDYVELDGAPSAAGTDFGTPLLSLLEDGDLRALVLVSDGDWNEGPSPYDAAMKYRLAGVPIFTLTVGSPTRLPDLWLEPVEPPAMAVQGRPLEVPVTVVSAMARDVATRVELSGPGGLIESRDVLLRAQRPADLRFTHRPTEAGVQALSVRVLPVDGETTRGNNDQAFEIDVREERLRVLLVESVPRWEFRYLRNALVRDPGVEVEVFLTHPSLRGVGGGPSYLEDFPHREALSAYDVVFVGDVGLGPEGLTQEQCAMVAGLVEEQASGLILMPGLRGAQLELVGTELGPLFPVDLDPARPRGVGQAAEAQLVLTEAGRASALTRLVPEETSNADLWSELPGFHWYGPVIRARTGARVLGVHGTAQGTYGRVPLLVTRTARTGKVLFMGTDAAWRWREGFEDRYHYRFWGQVIRWMAYQRSMNAGETMRLFFAPDRPWVRSTVTLNANVMDERGAPLPGADVWARVVAPSGKVERLSFDEVPGGASERAAWGLYTAAFRPTEPGRHQIALQCAETEATLEGEIPVVGRPLEVIGAPARFDVMDEIARLSRGSTLTSLSSPAITEALAGLAEPEPMVTRLRLWSHPLAGALLLLLMTALWIGRKAVGRV